MTRKTIYRTVGHYVYEEWYENGNWYLQRWDWRDPMVMTYEAMTQYLNREMDKFLEQELRENAEKKSVRKN